MIRKLARPMPHFLTLLVATATQEIVAAVRVVQIPWGVAARRQPAPARSPPPVALGPCACGSAAPAGGARPCAGGAGALLRVESIAPPLLGVARAGFSAGSVVALGLSACAPHWPLTVQRTGSG